MVHKYKLFDTNMVVDVNSGAVHIFDDISYEILDYYNVLNFQDILDKLAPKYDDKDITEAFEEIKILEKAGQLFCEDIYKDQVSLWNKKSVIKAMCLHVAHDCNMRCKYCFASTGDFGVQRSLMSEEVGKKAIDFIINESGNRINLEVDFFGGEPLMNFDVVKKVVDYARSIENGYGKNFRFTLTTNALALNEEHIKYINENMSNVVLSIDGRPEVNDNMRPRVDGSGTYKHIISKIKTVAQSRNQDNYYVRGTYTRENLDFSRDVLHLANEGFKQISIEPVVAAANCGLDIREQDLPTLFEEYEILAKEYVSRIKQGNGFNFFHFMIDLSQGPCAAKRLSGCGSGHEYIAVTPEGDIFPCHQFVGNEEFKMGDVDNGITNESLKEIFKNSNIYTKEKCLDCWAKFYCSGGCAANAYQFNKNLDKPYEIGCELEKKRLECALWAQANI